MPVHHVARVDSSSLFKDTILMPSGIPANSTLGSPIPCANKDKTRLILRERASSAPSGQQHRSTGPIHEGASPTPPRASKATSVSKLRGDALWEALSARENARPKPEGESDDPECWEEVSGADAICHVASVRTFRRGRGVRFSPDRGPVRGQKPKVADSVALASNSASSSKLRSSSMPTQSRSAPVSQHRLVVTSGTDRKVPGSSWSDNFTSISSKPWQDFVKPTMAPRSRNEAAYMQSELDFLKPTTTPRSRNEARYVQSELVETGLEIARKFQALRRNLGALKVVSSEAEALLGPTMLKEKGSQSLSLAELIESHSNAMTEARRHLQGKAPEELRTVSHVDFEALPAALALASAGLDKSSLACLENEVEAVLAVLDPPCSPQAKASVTQVASRAGSRPASRTSSRAGSQMVHFG
eukprot:gnl/MRDRNA2_/MRDRNA2_64657_c0_seq2.p1 gnl/MRDRNA2_/MRDRNA2_64657_c0~~gnl/MRDRNA2_/MRDRNA2_64657_c0_seq2.p1  ORF type:complete len:416 (-),score=77.20 gnl/MRDRNA2_/MRDRNA2_64657_c0_seq2:3-1250(-)